jgi:hypothetical protein
LANYQLFINRKKKLKKTQISQDFIALIKISQSH